MTKVNPFEDYPNFSEVLDDISEDGFHMHYRSMRMLYADEGTKWKRKWEPSIMRWQTMANNWKKFIEILRQGELNDSSTSLKIIEEINDIEVRDFFRRIHNKLITLQEAERLKRNLIEKSKDKNPIIKEFIENVLEQDLMYKKRNIDSYDFGETLKQSIYDYIENLEKIQPIMDISGIKMVTYEDYTNCIFTIKEIIGKAEFNKNT